MLSRDVTSTAKTITDPDRDDVKEYSIPENLNYTAELSGITSSNLTHLNKYIKAFSIHNQDYV